MAVVGGGGSGDGNDRLMAARWYGSRSGSGRGYIYTFGRELDEGSLFRCCCSCL